MKKLIIIALLTLAACYSPAKSWHIETDKEISRLWYPNSFDIQADIIDYLYIIFERWEINFYLDGGSGHIDIWRGPVGAAEKRLLGMSNYNTNCICKEQGAGVYIDTWHWKQIKHLPPNEIARRTAYVIAHEIGHAYGLMHNEGSTLYIMYPQIHLERKHKLVWSQESIDYFNEKLGLRK